MSFGCVRNCFYVFLALLSRDQKNGQNRLFGSIHPQRGTKGRNRTENWISATRRPFGLILSLTTRKLRVRIIGDSEKVRKSRLESQYVQRDIMLRESGGQHPPSNRAIL